MKECYFYPFVAAPLWKSKIIPLHYQFHILFLLASLQISAESAESFAPQVVVAHIMSLLFLKETLICTNINKISLTLNNIHQSL